MRIGRHGNEPDMGPNTGIPLQVVVSDEEWTPSRRGHASEVTGLPLEVIEDFQAGVLLFAVLATTEPCRVVYVGFELPDPSSPAPRYVARVTFVEDHSDVTTLATFWGRAMRNARLLQSAVGLGRLPPEQRERLEVVPREVTPRDAA